MLLIVTSYWWGTLPVLFDENSFFYCLITLICAIILISHIAQLLLICKFYCFRKGPHISPKYARHNHLRFPMMGEVSLET